MNKSFKTLAAAVLLGSTAIAPFAVAQDATPGATTTPPAASPTRCARRCAACAWCGSTAAAGTATYLTEQAENQISVADFMGQAIYTADNQSIGDINDLLVDKEGGVVAAVVGVGGFLGIGEKNVAVPFENITITRVVDDADAMTTTDGTATTTTTTATTDNTATNAEEVADAEVRLTTTETADSLRNAPEFRTLDDQAADAGTMGTTDGTTTSSTDN